MNNQILQRFVLFPEACHKHVHCVGAQLAGSHQYMIASNFIDRLNDQPSSEALQFRGVVFFVSKTGDLPPGVEQEGWYVMDLQKHITMKSRSPICEADAFVLFDEARCRYRALCHASYNHWAFDTLLGVHALDSLECLTTIYSVSCCVSLFSLVKCIGVLIPIAKMSSIALAVAISSVGVGSCLCNRH